MRIELTEDAGEFRRRAGEFLSRDPLRHTVVATAVDNFVSGLSDGHVLFAAVTAGDDVIGAGMRTGGQGVYLSDVPDPIVPELARSFAEREPTAPGVEAAPGIALVFAEQWTALHGSKFRMDFASRLYRLGTLRAPEAAGSVRRAVDADLELCVRWLDGMRAEVGVGMDRAAVRVRIALGRLWLWERDGRPVSMAAHQARAYGWSRIGPVYTPPEERRNGYAAALTAHVSQWLLDRGTRVCLFADLANPTSNKIYRAIGYEPVRTYAHYAFE
ncbi:GNAT family N-acetyltransferase [Nocardia sp. NPDC004068]|uniref:GNAT family N-acetyltransferase n=1 Tax=Nocardia sp. NPDC004068 TaxID=3364303 RepID=UPI0036887664